MPVTGIGTSGASGIPVPSPNIFGVLGDAKDGYGVVGVGTGPAGVYGQSNMPPGEFGVGGSGVLGVNEGQVGVGVTGRGAALGVYGIARDDRSGVGVFGKSEHLGVQGSGGYLGVIGTGKTGILGEGYGNDAWAGYGVRGAGENVGIYASNKVTTKIVAYLATRALAADFIGEVRIKGKLTQSESGFMIDHPLDPGNKYLHHSSVESSDRKNVYDGIAVLDGSGEAVVELPEWFGALNRDFRYQLTCLGGHAPVYIAQEIGDNRFRIAGGRAGLKVSWLVTGIRRDPWANANPQPPEQDKPEAERGTFLHPELYGEPEEKSLQRALYPPAPELPRLPPLDGSR